MKEITISEKSIFAFLYQFFYRKELPQSLCHFFWANLAALIFVVPYTLFILPTVIMTMFWRRERSFIKTWIMEHEDEFWDLIGINFLAWAGIVLLITYINGLYLLITYGFGTSGDGISIETFLTVTVIGILLGINWLYREKIKPWCKNLSEDKKIKEAIEWYENNYGRSDLATLEYILYKYNTRKKEDNQETFVTPWYEVAISAIKSFYERNCPRINWK